MYEDNLTPGEVLNLLASHLDTALIVSGELGKLAPELRVMSDKRLAATVYRLKYCASEILTTLKEVYPDVK